jgi:hypothetical protein
MKYEFRERKFNIEREREKLQQWLG